MSSNKPTLTVLRESLESMHNLRRSAWSSLALMATGILVVVFAFGYSITKVRSLEAQVAVLGEKRIKLDDDIKLAQSQLEKTRAESESALAKLKDIASQPLPIKAKAVIDQAISHIEEANKNLRGAETELVSDEKTASPSSEARRHAIQDLFDDEGSVRVRAYGVIMDSYADDPQLITDLLSFANAHLENENGIYNTLVVLSHLDQNITRPHVAEIKAFANEVQGMGPRIKQRVDTLLARLPEDRSR